MNKKDNQGSKGGDFFQMLLVGVVLGAITSAVVDGDAMLGAVIGAVLGAVAGLFVTSLKTY